MFKFAFPVLLCLVLTDCQLLLPPLDIRENSVYLDGAAHSRLNQILPPGTHSSSYSGSYTTEMQDDGNSEGRLYLLDDALEAFVARAALIDQADSSLDIRYYIWRTDYSGTLLLQKLWQAAERGVRIRLLLDDNNTRNMDNVLLFLDKHPNIQIRLFNPFTNRYWRPLAYLGDFSRLNRRMHNKSLTADNYASIIGGRNIGDEYFNAAQDTAFADLDILVQGEIVDKISKDFDRYWNSNSSYPAALIIGRANTEKGKTHLFTLPKNSVNAYFERMRQSPLYQMLIQGNVPFVHSKMKLISDDPAKALDQKTQVDIMQSLDTALQQPQRSVYLVSPYFVPTKNGMEIVRQMRDKGIDITVFTNSLKATDVAAVHSGYARYRKPLLRQGVHLYEFKAAHAVPKGHDKGLTGSPTTSLHTKTFIVDKERLFVGSLNLDPRSAKLNTEMGLVVYHPELAAQLENSLREHSTQTAYHLSLDDQQHLRWQDPETGNDSRHEPEASFWKRWLSRFLSILPIERLL